MEDLADKIKSITKLHVQAYMIDITVPQDKQAILDYLKQRGSALDENTIMTNSFILGNTSNDVWFNELSLVKSFEQDIQYYYKYFDGPKVLPNLDFLLGAQSNLNDLHIVTYCSASNKTDLESLKKMKNFRQMN